MTMSFAEIRTADLWKSFMPGRMGIQNNICRDLYAIQIYAPLFFQKFNPNAEFKKWAAVEVTNFVIVPNETETSHSLVDFMLFFRMMDHRLKLPGHSSTS
jgi:AraC family transcriptional regulator